jgi:phosphatidylinositol alpha-1,6-mannosyltransferase
VGERPLEIGFIANGFPPKVGGTELYNLEYARRLHERGHRVSVFTWGDPSPEVAEADATLPLEVHREPRVLRGGQIDPRGVEAMLERWQPDVAFVSRGSRKLRQIVQATSRRVPVVLSVHELRRKRRDRGRLGGWRAKRHYGLQQAARITVNSEDTRTRLLALGVPDARLAVVHPGVDITHFAPDPEAGRRAREQLGLVGKRVLLTVARLAAHKGQQRVIEALARLREPVPNLVYVVVGQGRTRKALERHAAQLGVADRVYFTGLVPDVRCYYQACDVFVMVSERADERAKAGEGFGITYVEAGACGKPVVASASGGGAEIVVDGATGYVVDPQDETRLETVLAELLTDPEQAQKLGEQARQRVQRYDWNRGLAVLEGVLRTAASRPSARARR